MSLTWCCYKAGQWGSMTLGHRHGGIVPGIPPQQGWVAAPSQTDMSWRTRSLPAWPGGSSRGSTEYLEKELGVRRNKYGFMANYVQYSLFSKSIMNPFGNCLYFPSCLVLHFLSCVWIKRQLFKNVRILIIILYFCEIPHCMARIIANGWRQIYENIYLQAQCRDWDPLALSCW